MGNISNQRKIIDVSLRVLSWVAWSVVTLGLSNLVELAIVREQVETYFVLAIMFYVGCRLWIDKIDILNKKNEHSGMSRSAFIVNLILIVMLVTSMILSLALNIDILFDLFFAGFLLYIVGVDLKAILSIGKKNAPSTDGA